MVALPVAVAALLAGVFVMTQYFSPARSARLDTHQQGKGPYRTTDCTANLAIAERLSKVVKQLHDAAAEEAWQIDWERFNAYGSNALAAMQRQDYGATVREYCRGMSFIMDQLRHQSLRNTKPTRRISAGESRPAHLVDGGIHCQPEVRTLTRAKATNLAGAAGG